MAIFSTAGVSKKGEKFFIALRKPGTSIGERWEFPGGKAKDGEQPEEALKREYREEFSVEITVGELITTGQFSNKGREYTLLAYYIDIQGEPVPAEHQETRWADLEELNRLDFPDSDSLIINALNMVFPHKT